MNELLDDIVYALFLIDYEFEDNEHGRKTYAEQKALAMQPHIGDCTWDACPCARCGYEQRFNAAKTILRILYDKGYVNGGKVFAPKEDLK